MWSAPSTLTPEYMKGLQMICKCENYVGSSHFFDGLCGNVAGRKHHCRSLQLPWDTLCPYCPCPADSANFSTSMHLGGLSVSILAHVEGIKSMEQRAKSVQILISAQPARILVLVDCLVSSEIFFLSPLWALVFASFSRYHPMHPVTSPSPADL